jgi:hypothetical protein
MFDLENKPPPPATDFISLTPFGTQHDHNKLCTPTFKSSDDFQGKISHLGTPINPRRTGRMICVGGTDEVKYLGFENFAPDPKQDRDMLDSFVNGRRSPISSQTTALVIYAFEARLLTGS